MIRSPWTQITARRSPLVVTGSLLILFLLLVPTACEQILPPVDEPEYDNPQDPGSPSYMEPETYIVSGPVDGSVVNASTVTIAYEGNEGAERATIFQTRLNDSPWSEWSDQSSTTLEYLDELFYTFDVRSAYDSGAPIPTLIDPSPASISFTVDAVQGPSLRFSPPSYTTTTYIPFELQLVAEEVTDLMLVSTVIKFDPSKLTAESVSDGDFFGSAGGSVVSYYTIDDTAGRIEINTGTAAGNPPGVSGSGTVAIIQFHGVSIGEYNITFESSNTFLRDHLNQDIPIQSLVGTLVRVEH